LYVPGYGNGIALSNGGAYVAAFDATGSKGCTVYSVGRVCVPMWTTTGPIGAGNSGSPTIANGVLYIANAKLLAFNAAGSTNCTGTPTVCSPLWTGTMSNNPTYSAPSVANGIVYIASWDAKLYTFGAAGTINCSVTAGLKTCTPLWTAMTPTSIYSSPAVAKGTVYTLSSNGTLSAFDAMGSTDCSGAMLSRTCTPLWASAAGGAGYATESPTALAIANGVVYFASTSGALYGFDAAGSINCSVTGGAKRCTSLWNASPGSYSGAAVVANGVVYFNGSQVGSVWAYSL
jgi:outer membrane protein assembly factor BamB